MAEHRRAVGGKMLTVVKIGGNVVDDDALLAATLDALAAFEGDVILVHGGGAAAERLAVRLGVQQTMIDGRRVTDAETLDIAVMVYAGLLSKRIVAMLQVRGRNAIGMSGADGNCLRGTRRSVGAVDFGHVGDVTADGVDTTLLGTLLDAGILPVLCAVTHDGSGALLNTNADTVASVVAQAFARGRAVRALFCFDQPGVLVDVTDASSVLSSLTDASYRALRTAGAVSGGMLPKLDAAFDALRGGARVRIMHAGGLAGLAAGIDTGGTHLVL